MPLPTGNLYDNYLIHGCYYRHINDLCTPWVPSPTVLPRELDDEDEAAIAVKITPYLYSSDATSSAAASSFSLVSSTPSNTEPQVVSSQAAGRAPKRRQLSRVIKRLLGVNNRSYLKSESHEQHAEQRHSAAPSHFLPKVFTGWKGPFPAMSPGVEIIPLSDWKAWGYYVSPFVNGVFVKNHSLRPRQFPSLDYQEMFESLRRPDEPNDDPIECEHPERWRRGQQLPSLPPRPARWKPINPLEPPPFPWECQLNPALTLLDPLTHTPTIEWSVTNPSDIIFFYTGPNGRPCPMRQPDFLQPATYPFVSHMYLNGLAYASDADGWWARDYMLPWPVTVICREHNEGIVLDDLFHGIYTNFSKDVSQTEFVAWPDEVQTRATQAYSQRIEREVRIFQIDDAGSRWYRRSDYLGLDHHLYRVRPNSNFEGWTLLMGPRPPQ